MAYELLLALSLTSLLLTQTEAMQARHKVTRLTKAINKETIKPYPVNADTRTKVYLIGGGLRIVFALIFVAPLLLIDLQNSTLLNLSITVLLINLVSGLLHFNEYHVDIQKLINKFKNSN